MGNNNLLIKNEFETNKLCAKIMMASIGFLAVVYLMQILKIFLSDLFQVGIAFSIATILLLIPAVFVFVLKKESYWIKYMIVTNAVLTVAIINIFLSKDVVVLWIYAVTLASLYFSKKLSWYSLIVSMIFLTTSQIISTNTGLMLDANYQNDWFIPVLSRDIEVAALALIYIILSGRTKNMLENVVGSEEQKTLLNKLLSLINKSTKVSNILVSSVNTLSNTTNETTKLNEQITNNTSQITIGSENANSFINQATESIFEISGSLSSTAEEGKVVSDMSAELNRLTENSGIIIKEAVKEMKVIEKTTIESKDIINKLGQRSNEIGQIVEVIKEISGQTNLLALNAAIEAARSGEFGRGFAVVADEIRKLAEQSEKATKEIASLINEVLQDTSFAVESMERNAVLVGNGLDIINKAGLSFENVASTGKVVNDRVQEIAQATQEAADSGNKLVELVEEIRDINNKNLDELKGIAHASQGQLISMKEVAASVDDISDISAELIQVLEEMS
ncbi:MAG: methyl-accepting chemotaxis protein [Lutisporaceae bacterium]